MAVITRYVDTASSGGDGTTENHSGATAAYASLTAWESAEQVDLVAAGDSHEVHCSGTSRNNATVTIAGWTTDATHTITIFGNRSATDNDGFYSGDAALSASHFAIRKDAGSGQCFIPDDYVILDGVQVELHITHASYAALSTSWFDTVTFRNCRIHCESGHLATVIGLGNYGNGGSGVQTIENCLITGPSTSYYISFSEHGGYSPDLIVSHNTIYGGTAGTGYYRPGSGASATQIIKGNAIANTADSFNVTAGGTITYNDNATDDYDQGTTGEIDLGATTDAWTNPGTATTSDFTVKDSSSALWDSAATGVVTDDLLGTTRSGKGGANDDVGCYESAFTAGGAAGISHFLPLLGVG